jgi:hypothetical protein
MVVRAAAVAAAVLAVLVSSCSARAEFVDLELVLAVDTSSSVNYDEFNLQVNGFAAAFRNPLLIRALEAAEGQGGVAVCMVQWSDTRKQEVAVDWFRVHDAASAAVFADRIEGVSRLIEGGGTSISGAIDFSVLLFDHNGFEGRRKVIDVSGDGRSNIGRLPAEARDDAIRAGITINGLAILNEEPNVDRHYARSVIGGANAFITSASDYQDFADAILLKLVREISGDILSGLDFPLLAMIHSGDGGV